MKRTNAVAPDFGAVFGQSLVVAEQRARGLTPVTVDELKALDHVDTVLLPEELDIEALAPKMTRGIAAAIGSGPLSCADDLRLAHPADALDVRGRPERARVVLEGLSLRLERLDRCASRGAAPEALEKEARLASMIRAVLPVLAEIDETRERNVRH